jgi:MFS family permease
LILGVLVATSLVKVWMVYVLSFTLGFVTIFDSPTRQTFLFELVGPENLSNAVTLYSILFNLARIIGPAIAAALIAVVGLGPCFIINGISYVAVVIMLAMMRANELNIIPPVPYTKGQFQEGLKYVVSTPALASTLLMMGVVGMLTLEFSVSLPLVAQFTYKGDAASYAFLTAAMGFGAAVGGIFFASRKRITPYKLVIGALLLGLAVLAAACMPSLLLCGLVMVLVGTASINFSTLGNTALQLESSPEMRGRVMSWWSVVWVGSSTIGGPAVGWFAQVAGARAGLVLGGAAALLAAALGAVTLHNAQAGKTVAARQEKKPV